MLSAQIFPPNLEMRAMPRLVSFTPAFALQLRKITENLSQGSRKSASWYVSGSTLSASVCQAVEAHTALFKAPVRTAL